MQRSNHSVNTLTIREFVAIHMMAVVARPDSQHYSGSYNSPPSPQTLASRAAELTDALLLELNK